MRINSKDLRRACVAVAAGLFASSPAFGVIVSGNNGTGTNNVLPASSPVAGAANSGSILSGSGVYLGNRWVLTASHIAASSTIGAGTPFTLVDGRVINTDQTSVRLTDPSNNGPTDLLLLHLASDPNLPTLNIGSTTPSNGTTIFSMGNGLTRSSNVQFYSVSGSTWTPLPTSAGANASGYTESTPHVFRWGNNLTAVPAGGSGPTVVTNYGYGNVTLFATTFDSAGLSSESQVSDGDSGGPVFDQSNNLIGINLVTSTFSGQPADTAIFGDQSLYADLATYRSQIVSTTGVPEPTTIGLLGASAAGLLLRRRSRR